MYIFPTIELKFKLRNSQDETLERLNRRTEYSKNLTSQFTDKSFRGIINGSKFKIISSSIGRGPLCVMSGNITSNQGDIKVEIHKVFKILMTILLSLPIIIIILLLLNPKEVPSSLYLILIIQFLFVRLVIIGLAFKLQSKSSLKRFRNVLDIEWV